MLSGYPWDSSTHTMLCAGGEDKVGTRFEAWIDNSPPGCMSRRLWWSHGVSGWPRRVLSGRGCQLGGGMCHRGYPRYLSLKVSGYLHISIFIPGVYTNVRKYNAWIKEKTMSQQQPWIDLSNRSAQINFRLHNSPVFSLHFYYILLSLQYSNSDATEVIWNARRTQSLASLIEKRLREVKMPPKAPKEGQKGIHKVLF